MGQNIASHEPHLVLLGRVSATPDQILAPVEQAWVNPNHRPHYLLTARSKTQALSALAAGDDDLRLRIRGTQLIEEPSPTNGFVMRYEEAHGRAPGAGTTHAYDGMYVLAFAGLAATSNTGSALAAALGKLVQGPEHQVGPGSVDTVASLLSSGGSVNLEGASGGLDFDAALGFPPEGVSIWCIDSTGSFTGSGQIFDWGQQALAGTYNCP